MLNNTINILLVDDEIDILEFIRYNLQKKDLMSIRQTMGKAISKALEIKPHLILLDVMMPEMDGIETCIELKNIRN